MPSREIEPLFLPASFFMARTPLLPLESFYEFCNHPDLPFSLFHFSQEQRNLFLEAIAVASSSLYKSISEKKETDQTLSSLVKYFSRMATRSTPFGLFSFVSMGFWGENTLVQHDLTQVQKRARPDMEWLYAIIDQLVANPELEPFLFIQSNPLIFKSGDRIDLNYYRKKNQKEETKTISIKSNFLTQAIFEIAQETIELDHLLDLIIDRFPSLIREKVAAMVRQLIQQQYLTTTLQPSLLTASPFQDFLKKLESAPVSTEFLQEISSKIDCYHQSALGHGCETFFAIQKAMKNEKESPNLIQVDSFNKTSTVQLSYQVAEDLSEVVEFLWKISNDSYQYPLRHYCEKFSEKYGPYRAVPLFELLHEERGLGTPKNYSKDYVVENRLPDSKWRKWLKNKLFAALHEKEYEIKLTKDLFERVLKKSDPKKAMPSFDLFFEVIADSTEKVDRREALLLIVNQSLQGGATFGRFIDMFDEDCYKKLQAFFIDEEALNKEALILQSSYLPYITRNANVAIQPHLRKYSVDLEGEGNIALRDIYIRVNQDRLYLTLKDSQREVIVTTCNMLNSTLAPIPIRLLLDISSGRHTPCFPFSWMVQEDIPFLPRIRYKNIILYPATWKVDLFRLGLEPKVNNYVLKETFQKWADLWNMPRYVYVGEGDQRILIDRRHPTFLKEIIHQLKKEHLVTFVEKVDQDKGSWIQSQLGTHASEFVLPFIKNPKYVNINSVPFAAPISAPIAAKDRWKLPGSEWLFVKFYLSEELENRFLIGQLQKFSAYLIEKKAIDDWFFVRYSDAKPHLRIRFRGNKERLMTQFVPALNEWSSLLLEEGYFSDMTFSTYEREVERYGGSALIDYAESLFCIDSYSVLTIISALLNKKINLPEEVLATLSLIDFLKNLGLDLENQLSFYAALDMPKEELAGFRKHKSPLLSFGKAILQDRLSDYSDTGSILSEAFQARSITLSQFASKMRNQENLTSNSHTIINSIIHMHCNRLLGRDNKKELKVRLYAYETLNIINKNLNRTPEHVDDYLT